LWRRAGWGNHQRRRRDDLFLQGETVPYQRLLASSNPFDSITNFFKSSTWHFMVLMFWFLLAAIWLATVYWVFKDARRRIDDKIIITVAVLAALIFPFAGMIIYVIVRPPEYLDDVQERDLEMRMIEARLGDEQRCGFCKTPVRDDFLVCPNCQRRLRTMCPTCRRPLEPEWKVCPYCETPVRDDPSAVYDRAYR
jgi:RNA polymerase subunit RPABC4/transcription elongation factor Spt4